MDPRAKLEPAAVAAYVFAGHATFTIVSLRTGERLTFKVTRADGDDPGRPWFVALLRGPDNEADYSYLGCVFPDRGGAPGEYRRGRKSKIGAEAPSQRLAEWFFPRARAGAGLAQVEVWHEGRCGRCGRTLTVPESVASGIGPVCAGAEAA